MAENVPLAIAIGNEKARSELIIAPILVELRKKLLRQIALFSGASFDVDYALGLNGIVDFLISRNPEQYAIEAPILVLVEAKRADLNFGMGQVVAEMVAAQIFNLEEQQNIERVFGCISNGMQWRFLCLEQKSLHIEPIDIDLYPIDRLLGILKWAIET